MSKSIPKVYGREARIRAMVEELSRDGGCKLPDMCIDMMYSVMVNF